MKKVLLLLPFFLVTAPLLSLGLKSKPYKALLDTDGVQRVEIKVDSYYFEPDHIVVTVNTSVEITLRSVTSLIPHNFTIHYPDAGLDVNRDIPHGRDVKVRFVPQKTGKFEFYCNKKLLFINHREKGMVGVLEVVNQG